MRRQEREITGLEEIIEIMEQCQILSLALGGSETPYVVPVNFGLERGDGKLFLYFHGAPEGTKIDRIRADGRAAFCMVDETSLELQTPACGSTMRYASVCGSGRISFVEDPGEKLRALACIMRQYDREGTAGLDFDEKAVKRTAILRLAVEEIRGKSNRRKEEQKGGGPQKEPEGV